jgi:hypothetical protein
MCYCQIGFTGNLLGYGPRNVPVNMELLVGVRLNQARKWLQLQEFVLSKPRAAGYRECCE